MGLPGGAGLVGLPGGLVWWSFRGGWFSGASWGAGLVGLPGGAGLVGLPGGLVWWSFRGGSEVSMIVRLS